MAVNRRGSEVLPAVEGVEAATGRPGARFERRFSVAGRDPFDSVEWETRTAEILDVGGETIFRQEGVEVPSGWSQTATNVTVSKYFFGALGSPERETSVRQLVTRVVDAIAGWGVESELFADAADAAVFRDELAHVLLDQMACFNSPVWFNVGIDERPQCSACFINSVEDNMPSILELAKTEGMLFKYGSGTGSNLSTLRSSREALSGGGVASGPVSFMRGYDAFAGVIKSGGRTRRAAKMVILDVDHPDVPEFIRCKADEERKARALIEAGFDSGFETAGGAYDSVFYQNANHSVRVSDGFMRAVEADRDWTTHAVSDGEPMDTYRARELLEMIADAAWECGDPGVQFDTTINAWHTCPESAPIRASNPCSEYMFLDDTACNLASLNLMRFYDESTGAFEADAFRHACEVVITAQEILVGRASYPTPAIERNSHDFRPLGLGYANLGALLMARGLPYDSAAGRAYAAAVTALMSGAAYAQSARLAALVGPFAGFAANREPMLGVIDKHAEALQGIDQDLVPEELFAAADSAWSAARRLGGEHGFRNSQISVLAPTGTIAFMMDCDTTGVEPDIALVKYKRLVGGGNIKIVNRTVPAALKRLGYDKEQRSQILEHVRRRETIEGAPGLSDEHLAVFDCAFEPRDGSRSIHYRGHLAMLAAVQPFISGAISKTVNLPQSATRQEIYDAVVEGWKLGLKALALYRDGCKSSQPLSTSSRDNEELKPRRRRLPVERQAVTHKFAVGGHEGYVTVGTYEDGAPGEIFIVMAKEGSTISGLMDSVATSVSIALQYGVPLTTLVGKFVHTRFEPSGFTQNPAIPMAKSVMDYIFRWLASKFLSVEEQRAAGVLVERLEAAAAESEPSTAPPTQPTSEPADVLPLRQQDAPACQECGSIMVRNGTCYKCLNCGSTSGCS